MASIGRFPGDRKADDLHFALDENLWVSDCVITVGTEAANVINASVQMLGSDAENLTDRACFVWYLSGDADGDGQLATEPTTMPVTVGTDGVILQDWDSTTDTMGHAITNASGAIDFDIGDTGTPTMYLIVILPNGRVKASSAITFA
jgi:hypothetical protein